MLRLVGYRARAQWPVLAALLTVVFGGATLLGTCALLLTRTGERAVEVAASRAGPDDVDVTAFIGTVRGPDARSVAADTRALVTAALAPFTATTSARASTVMRSLVIPGKPTDAPAQGYLSGVDDLSARAALTAGRWPVAGPGLTGPAETVVLESTARQLGLVPGSRVRLGAERGSDAATAVMLDVVGVVRPLPGTGWQRDILAAVGYDPAYHSGGFAEPAPAYGPFLVDLDGLLAGGSTIERMEITAHPDLAAATRRDLEAVAGNLRAADRQLAYRLGDRVQIERVAAALPATLAVAQNQQRVTTAVVLAVAVLASVLTAVALALAGRLTAAVRDGDTVLLSALGVSRSQLAIAASVEAGLLAVVAAALAIPSSSALHAGLTRLPPLVGAGLRASPAVTGVQVLVVAGSAFALAAGLVLVATRPVLAVSDRRDRRELLARSGVDLLLMAFAAIGWWQLGAQPAGAGARADVVRVLAPGLLLTASAALALRLVQPGLRIADRVARRGRGFVVPLAAFEAARRPQAVAAGLLIGLAGAAGTFGIGFNATWDRSQHDQADLSVGTDLVVTLTSAPAAGAGAVVARATGGVVSPATDRGIAVGQWLGTDGEAPRLVAIDATRAGDLLRGRLAGGRDWAQVGATLALPARAAGVPLPVGVGLTMTGTATGVIPQTATPELLLQDGTGLRTTCTAGAVPLDGRAHELPACATVPGLQLVAVSLVLDPDRAALDAFYTAIDSGELLESAMDDAALSQVAVTLTVPALTGPGPAAPDGAWHANWAPPTPEQLVDPAVTLATTSSGTQLALTAKVQLLGAYDARRHLVATAFPDPGPVPVAVSSRLADQLNVHSGSRLTLTVGGTPVPVVIRDVVPSVPSAPGAIAVLADLDALSRALVVGGDLEPPVDAWWVGRPDGPDAAARATALHLGTVATRSAETTRLTDGPVRAGLPAVLRLLVPAAALLLLVGVVLHVTCDLQLRVLEVARLQGLGLYRREIRTVLLGQHVGVLLPLLAVGGGVGAFATAVIAPLLVRSDIGAAAVPAPVPVWPWPAEGAFLALLLAGCGLAATMVVTVQLRRADAAHLRVPS